MWQKKGQVAFYGLMLGLTILIVALALAPAVTESVISARNETTGDTLGLNCSSSLISNFDKATCYATDLSSFYFIGSLIFIAGAVVTAKIIFGSSE